jgi:Neutral/alkaline non-lysosomal ceramidase.
MNIAARFFAFFWLAALGLGFQFASVAAGSNDSIEAGAAEIDITPPVGMRMAGYFDERFATGVHDPLKAKALILRQGDKEIAMVFCDLVGVSLNVTTNARAQAGQKTGIPVPNIMICATHSHTGPLFDDVRDYYFHEAAVAKFGKDPHEPVHYATFLTEKLVAVIAEAHSKLHAAQLEVGIATQENLTFNRRYWMKNGKVAFNPGQLNTNIVRAAGPSDTDVGILFAREPEAKHPFAGLTVFAMHSDTVGGSEYSADYAYFLQQMLRSAYSEDFISAFAAGTCGDLNHINVNKKEPVKGFDVAERLGTTLGATVKNARLSRITKPSLAVRSTTLQIPLQQPSPEELADARSKTDKIGDPDTPFMNKVILVKNLDLARRGPACPMEVQVMRLDSETAFVFLPCEIFAELGLAIKHSSPFKKTIVISICNDRPSYVPTKKAFTEGSYEVTNARVKSGAGEMLVDAAVKLLKEIKN